MTTLVNAAAAGRWLDGVMEDQACDLREDAIIFNPDSEINSLFEYAARVYHLAPEVSRALVLDLAVLRRINLQGFRAVRPVVGEIDDFQRRLRGLELNTVGGSPSAAHSVKALARRLRPPLQVLADTTPACGEGGAARDAALLEVGGALATVPGAQLHTPSLMHDLGAAKATALRRAIALHRITSGAGALATPGSVTTEVAGDREPH